MVSVIRGLVAFGLLALFASAASSSAAMAATPAETFVQQGVDRGVQILKDTSLTEAQRRAQVE
jgi:Spy/CpxP family protein refolding chaperone